MKFILGDLQKVFAVVDDLAALHDGVSCENTEDRFGGYGFTRTGFAYDGECFALGKVKVDAADSLHLTIGGAEGYRQIFYMKFIFHISHPLLS